MSATAVGLVVPPGRRPGGASIYALALELLGLACAGRPAQAVVEHLRPEGATGRVP